MEDGRCCNCGHFISDWTGKDCEHDYCTVCIAGFAQKAIVRARDEWKEYRHFQNELDARNLAFKAVDTEIAKL